MFAVGWNGRSFDRFNSTHMRDCGGWSYDTREPTKYIWPGRGHAYEGVDLFIRNVRRFTLHRHLEDTY